MYAVTIEYGTLRPRKRIIADDEGPSLQWVQNDACPLSKIESPLTSGGATTWGKGSRFAPSPGSRSCGWFSLCCRCDRSALVCKMPRMQNLASVSVESKERTQAVQIEACFLLGLEAEAAFKKETRETSLRVPSTLSEHDFFMSNLQVIDETPIPVEW